MSQKLFHERAGLAALVVGPLLFLIGLWMYRDQQALVKPLPASGGLVVAPPPAVPVPVRDNDAAAATATKPGSATPNLKTSKKPPAPLILCRRRVQGRCPPPLLFCRPRS
jgi:hypothetical protein